MFKQSILSLALIGAGVLGISSGPAAAFTVPQHAAVEQASSSPLLTEVAQRNVKHNRHLRRYWNHRRDGIRCKKRFGNCRHYYRGYYYASPWWTLPLVGGTVVIGSPGYAHRHSSRHVQWCKNHYRSYNVRTNTWIAYSGAVRQCVSPFK